MSYTFWLGEEAEELQRSEEVTQRIVAFLTEANKVKAEMCLKGDLQWAWIMGRRH